MAWQSYLTLIDSVDTPPAFDPDARVSLRDGSVLHLSAAGPLFDVRRFLLQRLHDLDWPPYLETETDDAGKAIITSVRIPLAARVIEIRADGRPGWVHVRLDRSSARHTVNADSTAGRGLVDRLESSWRSGELLLLVDDPSTHEIVGVFDRQFPERFDRFSKSVVVARMPVSPPDTGSSVLDRLHPLSERDLTRVFAAASTDACGDPRDHLCVPFVYPDDGCWARAQRMCDNIERAGFRQSVAKVWVYGDLVAPTRNHPACRIEWDWHCAPIVSLGEDRYRVIDPALDPTAPLRYDLWRTAIAGIDTVRFTDSWVFKMAQPDELRGPSDRFELDETLEVCRLRLIDRMATEHKSPPYCG